MTAWVAALPAVTFITGTDTDVGKTVTTAALAAVLSAGGSRVAVYKPAQTGVGPADPGDMGEVRRLAGVTSVHEGVRLREPMAPAAAATAERAALPPLAWHVARIRALAAAHDTVLVEGAGGLLVALDGAGHTIADLAAHFPDAATVVVCRSALGTLNHTLLTLEALRTRGLRVGGVVVGAWPARPSAVERSNLAHFNSLDVPVLGRLPEHAARLPPGDFRHRSRSWLVPGVEALLSP
ncbi:dethiobiotin synthase [Specibacter cremeus]|uniref:dethiobiotin synthase n=1 Tax=Specibacter cremeus TaxID=1629051 RepID=UPI000F7A7348|nr:dethiobiotin synthase [Specibacter cremeus]